MAQIQTYTKKFQSSERGAGGLGQTAKLSGGDQSVSGAVALAGAKADVGRATQNLGNQISNTFMQIQDTVDKGKIAGAEVSRAKAVNDAEQEWQNTIIAQSQEGYISPDGKTLSTADKPEFMKKRTDAWVETVKQGWGPFASKKALGSVMNFNALASEREGAAYKGEAYKAELDKAVFQIKNLGDISQKEALLAMSQGRPDDAAPLFQKAKDTYANLIPLIGEENTKNVIGSGAYTVIVSNIDDAQDQSSVDATIKHANETKDVLSPQQYADILRRGDSRERAIKAEEIRLVTQQKRDYKDNYDQYQARSMSTFQSPMSPQELVKIKDAGLISEMEVYQGQIQFDKHFKTEATAKQDKNYKDLDYNIKVGSVASYGDIWKSYQSGDVTLDDARKAEIALRERVGATRTTDQATAFGKRKDIILTGESSAWWEFGGTITSIDEYNNVMLSINDDKSLSIDDRISQFEAVTALYSQRKDPAMSTAYHQEYIKLMNIENMMRKYDPNFKAGSFTNKIFSAKVKSPEEVINAAKTLTTQYQAKIDASIQAGLKEKPSYQSGRITVIDSNGKLFTVPASQKDEAIKAGYKVQ